MKEHFVGPPAENAPPAPKCYCISKKYLHLYQEQTYLFFLFQNIPNGKNLKTQYKLKVSYVGNIG